MSGYFYITSDGRLRPLEEAPDEVLRAYAAMRDSEDTSASLLAHLAAEELKRRTA